MGARKGGVCLLLLAVGSGPARLYERNLRFSKPYSRPTPSLAGPLREPWDYRAAGSISKDFQHVPSCAATAAVGALSQREVGLAPYT